MNANFDKWGSVLPKRILGNTGKEVTMLGVGGYHVGWTTERDAQAVIEAALNDLHELLSLYVGGDFKRGILDFDVPTI